MLIYNQVKGKQKKLKTEQLKENKNMLAFVGVIEREDTITVDGYTTNKTEKGIIKDVARAIRKYSKTESDSLMECVKNYDPDFDSPFLKGSESFGGYFFEYEEVPCASSWNEETQEVEYKNGYNNYFVIRICK